MDIVERLMSAAITTSGRMSANHRLEVSEALIDAATEIAQLRKDAERYRWLRRRDAGDQWRYMGGVSGEKMDAQIDAAIREEGANTGDKPPTEGRSA